MLRAIAIAALLAGCHHGTPRAPLANRAPHPAISDAPPSRPPAARADRPGRAERDARYAAMLD